MPSSRRSTAEVRQAILDAAAECFASSGYGQTSVRQVAEGAGVSLSVLYRHFADKDELFTAALLAPFGTFLDEFSQAWRQQLATPVDDEIILREFVRDLYHALAPHRAAIVALISLSEGPNAALAVQLRSRLTEMIVELGRIGVHEVQRRDWPDAALTQRRVWVTVALVAGEVLLEPWLREAWGGDAADPSEEVIDTMTRLLVHGLRLAP